mmetsp:Transcript_12669/g.29425  ORF Transcript_12669/g.29425 Transcript_12669/m.29425 type:complete len:276 (+) Transcript_12669:2325-3152(+)
MYIIINICWQVIIYHLGYVGNVQPTACDICCNHHRCVSTFEGTQGFLALSLALVSVNRAGWKPLITENVFNEVAGSLCFHKNQNEAFLNGEKETHQRAHLIVVFHIFHSLGDILGCRTDSSNCQENVVAKKITGESLNIWRKRGTEHHSLSVISNRHSFFFHNASYLGLESHVQHSISLIKDKESDNVHCQTTTFHQINKTARCCHQQITSALDLTQLLTHICTTIHHNRRNSSAVGKLPCFVLDLGGEFACWCKHKGLRVYATTSILGRVLSST